MSCFSACFLCTQPRMQRFANSPSRRSGTLIIYSFHLCLVYIPMPLDVSYGIPRMGSRHLLATSFGIIVSAIKAGDGNFGLAGSISRSASIARFVPEERLKSLVLFATNMVKFPIVGCQTPTNTSQMLWRSSLKSHR